MSDYILREQVNKLDSNKNANPPVVKEMLVEDTNAIIIDGKVYRSNGLITLETLQTRLASAKEQVVDIEAQIAEFN